MWISYTIRRIGNLSFCPVMASGQRVNRSTQVRRYVYPLDGGSGPTKSMWMTLKRASGLGKVDSGKVVCLWIFAR